MDTVTAVANYIEQVTGERPAMTTLSAADLAGLPVYLSRSWRVERATLLGRGVIFAFPLGPPRTGLSRVTRDRQTLAAHLKAEVIPVIPDIASHERRRLVQARVPFVAPGRQLFLPMFPADFRETFTAPPPPPRASMSWIAQLIVLRHLLRGGMEGRPLAEIAAALNYTAMAVTLGVRELEALGLCVKVPEGRARVVRFDLEPRALWERAHARMRSPVVRRYPVGETDEGGRTAPEAGLTALSRQTLLSYNGPRTVAVSNREAKRLVAEGLMREILDADEAPLLLEGWAYAPRLTADGPAVDDLSLWLSLKDDPDERVQAALADRMEQRTW